MSPQMAGIGGGVGRDIPESAMAIFRLSSRARALLLGVTISLASFAAISVGDARDLSLSLNPDSGAFTIGGWSRRVADTGTIFYTCEEDACGRGSTVSMRKQPQPISPDAEAMRRNEMRTSDALRERLKGKIEKIDIGEPNVSRDAAFSIGEISRTMTPVAGVDPGIQPYWKTGYVTNKTAMHTISSSANSRNLCDDNYNMFKFALMLSTARSSSRAQ